jgi:hypothetical protein
MASLTASSGYDRVWSSNLALTQGRCFPLATCAAVLPSSKLTPRRGRGYPPCVPAVGDIQWQPRSRRPEES